MDGPVINPLKRHPISEPLDVGIRSIMACSRSARPATRCSPARVSVSRCCWHDDALHRGRHHRRRLIGERGREVKEFIENILGEESIKRLVVASPADDAPLMRLRAAQYCTRIAEYFRDKGKNVLLLMDSLTRYAQAQREIALATASRRQQGYPPSVFAKLPSLVERAGNAEQGGGSITAFYTVFRGRRPTGPDRRCRARCTRRPYRAVASVGGGGPLPGHRHRGFHQSGDAAGGRRRARSRFAALQAALVPLSAEPRSDQRRRLRAGWRSGDRHGHCTPGRNGQLPASGAR